MDVDPHAPFIEIKNEKQLFQTNFHFS